MDKGGRRRLDIVPAQPRSVADALAIVAAVAPDHILVAWLETGDGADGDAVNVLAVSDDGDFSAAEVVYLCELVKLTQMGGPYRVGPVFPGDGGDRG